MKNNMTKIKIMGLLGAVLIAASATVSAQDAASSNAPAGSEQKAEPHHKHKKSDVIPFHGKLSAVDDKAMTLKIGERTIEITSETKITKDGKPATLADGVVGEPVRGAYKKGAEGKLTAISIHFGEKSESKKREKQNSSPGGSSQNDGSN